MKLLYVAGTILLIVFCLAAVGRVGEDLGYFGPLYMYPKVEVFFDLAFPFVIVLAAIGMARVIYMIEKEH